MRRGCIKPIVAPHLVRASFRMHAAMGTSLPAAVDLRETGLVARVKDQGGSSSCEGHSGSGATETAFALAGATLGYIPSEDALYKGLRSIERARLDSPSNPLTDNGGMTEDCLAFMSAFGLRPRTVAETSDGRNSDVELATVNSETTLGDLEGDADLIVVGPYAIDPLASDAEHQVQAALAAKIPVRADFYVDTAFENWTPGHTPIAAPNENDPNGGGHAVYLVGYRAGAYVLRNSWGESWADGGDCLVSPAWLRATWGMYPWACRRAS